MSNNTVNNNNNNSNTSTSTQINTNNSKGETKMSKVNNVIGKFLSGKVVTNVVLFAIAQAFVAALLGDTDLNLYNDPDVETLEDQARKILDSNAKTGTSEAMRDIARRRAFGAAKNMAHNKAMMLIQGRIAPFILVAIFKHYFPLSAKAIVPAIVCMVLGDNAPDWAKKPFSFQEHIDALKMWEELPIGCDASIKVHGLTIPTGVQFVKVISKNKEILMTVTFDYDNNRMSYRNNSKGEPQWKNLRDVVLAQYGVKDKAEYQEVLDIKTIMVLASNQIAKCKTRLEAENLIDTVLRGAIFKEIPHPYGRSEIRHNIFGEEVQMRTRQEIAEDKKVYPLLISNNESLKLSEGKVQGNSYEKLASNLHGPVAADKQASKYWTVEEGAEAMGLFLVDGKLVSYNPLNDANKGNNRIMANNFKYAVDASVHQEGAKSTHLFSNLVTVLSTGERTASHGVVRKTIIAPALGVAAQGIAITNNLTEEFVEPTTIRQEVSLYTLEINTSSAFSYEELVEECYEIKKDLIKAATKTKQILKKGDVIKYGDVVIYTHTKETIVTIVWAERNIHVTPGSMNIGNVPATINFKFNGYSEIKSCNTKYRGAGVKATALALTSKEIIITENNEVFSDWEILLTSESYKTVEKVMELYANSQPEVAIEIINGVLTKDGMDATEDFNNWLVNSLQTFTIKQKVHNSEVNKLKAKAVELEASNIPSIFGIRLGGHVTFDSIPDTEYSVAIQEVKALVGYGNYCIEISSADANYGNMKASMAMSYVQGTLNERVASGFQRIINKNAAHLPQVSNDKRKPLLNVDKEYNLDNAEEKAALLKALKCCNVAQPAKQRLGTLQSVIGDSFRLTFKTSNGKVWNADVPLQALVGLANYDDSGNPTDDYSSNAEEARGSISQVVNLIQLLGSLRKFSKNKEEVVDTFKYYQAHMNTWLNDLISHKLISKLAKSSNTSYMKVVGDFNIGTHKHVYKVTGTTIELPIVCFHSDNPIWKTVNVGDVLLMTRTPFPTAVAVVAQISDRYHRTVAAVAPSVMYEGTRGDFDGDSVQFTNIKKVSGCVCSYGEALVFNQSVWSLGGYQLTKASTGDIVTAALRDVYKNKTAEKFSTTVYTNTVEECSMNLALINEVYGQHVGTTYGYAANALITLFESNSSNNTKAALAVVEGFITYEEDCLGGYNKLSYSKVNNLLEEVKELEKSGYNGVIQLEEPQGDAQRTMNQFVRGQSTPIKVSVRTHLNFLVATAVGYEKARKVEEGKIHPESVAPIAISAYAIRNLSKKRQETKGRAFYELDLKYGVNHSYTKLVKVVALHTFSGNALPQNK